MTGNTVAFTPDFSAVSGAAMLTVLNGNGNYIGPYYINATVTSGAPISLVLTNTAGRLAWV